MLKKYLTRLFISLKGERPQLYFSRRLNSKHMEKADVSSTLARRGFLRIHEPDPDLNRNSKF